MTAPLISIIIPIYNVEPYLQRCLDSIVNQTYTNLEIILVDDGSPDGCPKICDDYAAKDNRIIVIHKKNGGLSAARNAGLDVCKGEYISFVDSDDWIAPKYTELLINYIQAKDAELAIAKFIKTYNNDAATETSTCPQQIKANVLNNLDAVKKLFDIEGIFFGIACGKLYKKQLFKNVRFPIGRIHEDDYTLYKILFLSQKTVFLDTPLYYYYQRSDSIMGTAPHSSVRALRAKVERYFFFKEKKLVDIQTLCLKNLCWELLFAYSKKNQLTEITGLNNNDRILDLFYICQRDHWKLNFPLIEKLILKILSYFPFIYTFYQNYTPFKIRKL